MACKTMSITIHNIVSKGSCIHKDAVNPTDISETATIIQRTKNIVSSRNRNRLFSCNIYHIYHNMYISIGLRNKVCLYCNYKRL